MGWAGTGILNIQSSGQVTAESVIVGDLEGSTGTINLSDPGSTLISDTLIEVGGSGTGLLNIRNEAVMTTAGQIVVGTMGEIDVNQPGLSAEITAVGGIVNLSLIHI